MSLFERCKLEGRELDAKVAELEGLAVSEADSPHYSTDWSAGGPIIERDLVFIDPPHDEHRNYGARGKRSGWYQESFWTATVSTKTRTRPNPNNPELPPTVGRGAGETLLIAAMRAYVDSKSTT